MIRGRRTREYEAKISLTKVAIRVGSSKFWAVTELIANRGWRFSYRILSSLVWYTELGGRGHTNSLTIPITPCR